MFKVGDIISLKTDNRTSGKDLVYKVLRVNYADSTDPVYLVYDISSKSKHYFEAYIIDLTFELDLLYLRKKKIKKIINKINNNV